VWFVLVPDIELATDLVLLRPEEVDHSTAEPRAAIRSAKLFRTFFILTLFPSGCSLRLVENSTRVPNQIATRQKDWEIPSEVISQNAGTRAVGGSANGLYYGFAAHVNGCMNVVYEIGVVST